MNKATELPQRKSTHLRDYNYSNPGYYFVTICTRDKRCLFGAVMAGEMRLKEIGLIVDECWRAITDHFSSVSLDGFVVMPNHIHAVIRLGDIDRASHASPLRDGKGVSLGAVVGSFKSAVTKQLRLTMGMTGISIWQRNYYDHVIRSDASLQAIREYIVNNPAQWALDRENQKFSAR